jgi:hypothetical protein
VKQQAPIPLTPGAQPISVPMYSASPAKREVIDKQMDIWFERGVIEPSTSLWGFPCVVVFRNGKPWLAVDYCKLNVHTIPDEYPIPRQSEIIQALSGVQVLSSFDALAGFNQVDMDEDARRRRPFAHTEGCGSCVACPSAFAMVPPFSSELCRACWRLFYGYSRLCT